MRKSILYGVFAFLIMGVFVCSASADTASFWGVYSKDAQMTYKNGTNPRKTIYVGHFDIGTVGSSDVAFHAYCVQSGVSVATSFGNKTTGYSFNSANFFSDLNTLYTEVQRNDISNLMKHIMPLAYSEGGEFLNTDTAKVVDRVLQVCLWEIQQEKLPLTGIDYDVYNGSYKLMNSTPFGDIANVFLDSLQNNNWDVLRTNTLTKNLFSDTYEPAKEILGVLYLSNPENTSQSFAKFGYKMKIEEVTPEPATLVMMGVGLVGAGFVSRRRTK